MLHHHQDTKKTQTASEPKGADPATPILKRFQLSRLLGEGGMGRVYEAYDPRLKRPLAVKLLKGNSFTARQRFANEARLQARVDHPHICKVYEVGEEGEIAYIAMQRVYGLPLGQVLTRLSLPDNLKLVAAVAEGVHAAHRCGLIHRDLKPGNIMVEGLDEGCPRPYVLDFGIARTTDQHKLTATGALLGTPCFMAPEQARGDQNLDARCDVYALGAILYTLLTGNPPHHNERLVQVLVHLQQDDSKRLRLPETTPRDLVTICRKAMAFDPGQRYATARAFAEDLHRFLDKEPILARRPTLGYRLLKFVEKNRRLVLSAGTALLVLVGSLVMMNHRAARREELVREITLRQEQIKVRHRTAMMARQHNTRESLVQIHQQMAQIAALQQRLGPRAQGPALTALGMAHLQLGELESARGKLEAAWESGYQTQQTALALGQTLARLYERAVTRELIVAALENRKTQMEDLERSLRDRARYLLTFCRDSPQEYPGIVEAQIAFVEGHYQRVLDLLKLGDWPPWLYELDLLLGKACLMLAVSPGTQDPIHFQECAQRCFERALASARSDSRIYHQQAQLYFQMLAFNNIADTEMDPLVKAGLAAADTALRVNPDDDEARWSALSFSFFQITRLLDRSEITDSQLDDLFEQAEHQARYLKSTSLSQKYLGNLYFRRARQEMNRKRDPLPYLKAALAAAEKVLPEDRDLSFQRNLGTIWMNHARFSNHRSEDETRAIEAFETVLRQEPNDFLTINSMGTLFLARAEQAEGAARERANDKAAALFRRSAELNPHHYLPLYHLGRIYESMGQAADNSGRDSYELYLQAEDYYCRGIDLGTHELHFVFGRGNVCYLQAWNALEAGRDPGPWLKQAYAAYDRVAKLAPRTHLIYQNRAMVEYLEARSLYERGRNPQPLISRSLASLAQARALAPGPTLDYLVARSHLLALKWARDRGRKIDAAAAEIEDLLAPLLDGDRPHRSAWLVRGELLLLEAQATKNQEEALNYLAQAHEALANARERNQNDLLRGRVAAYQAHLLKDRPFAQGEALAIGHAMVDRVLQRSPGNSRAGALLAVLLLLEDPADQAAAARLDQIRRENPYLVPFPVSFTAHRDQSR